MIVALVLLIWLACSVLAFGIAYADAQSDYPQFAWRNRRRDAGAAIMASVAGPVSVLVMFLATGFAEHGLRYRPIDREESWQEFHRLYPSLSRAEWERH